MVISTINIAEVYRSILRFYSEDFVEEKIEAMKQRAFVCDVIEEIAVEAAKIKHKKKWGLGDSLIYATAKKEGARVLTGDPDFKDVEGVIFIE